MRARAGQAGEIGQVRQRHIHPERARPGAKALDALDEVRRQVGRVHHPLVQQLGPDIGDDRAADHLFPALQPHADRPVAIHQHARDRRLQADLHAHRADHARHRLRDRAHAAHHMAPGALLPVHLAEHMVQQHIGPAGRVGRRIIADHRVETEHGLDRVAFEPAVQEAARRLGEQVQRVALLLDRQPGDPPALAQRGDDHVHAVADIGRALQHQIAHYVRHLLQRVIISGQGGGVAAAELGELRLALRDAAAQRQILAIGQRQEIADRALDHAIALLHQSHVANDLGIEQADRVAGGGIAEAGMELLRHCRAADDGPPLQDAHLVPRPRQVKGADQPIMPAADDDGVIALAHAPCPSTDRNFTTV